LDFILDTCTSSEQKWERIGGFPMGGEPDPIFVTSSARNATIPKKKKKTVIIFLWMDHQLLRVETTNIPQLPLASGLSLSLST
jgi:hypothetical protein